MIAPKPRTEGSLPPMFKGTTILLALSLALLFLSTAQTASAEEVTGDRGGPELAEAGVTGSDGGSGVGNAVAGLTVAISLIGAALTGYGMARHGDRVDTDWIKLK